ncbi:MAG: hypothetical protein KC478_09085 [Bacteriovoracaceae bacterium]|nr:hypothetical protein [Bacteriovoracaceae bacterium]
MNKLDKIILKYIVFALPFVIGLLAWGGSGDPSELSRSSGTIRIIWDFLGWNFMIWILASLFLTSKMVVSKRFRGLVLGKATKIKERDEMESLIAGNAAKFSFLSTLAILFLFLFMSLFTITLGKYPQGVTVPEEKNGYITIGMDFYPFAKKKAQPEIQGDGLEIFKYTGIPLSNSIMFLIIILWQVGSYHVAVRREEALLD